MTGQAGSSGSGNGSDRLWALAAGLIPFGVYVATLAPTLTLEDSGEFIAGAHVLGVLHPTGYPLWTLLAHAFTWIPVGSIAERVHLSSAFFGAGMCLMTFLCARVMSCRRPAALAVAVALGGSRILWTQSIVAEVYSLNGFLVMVATWLVLTWCHDEKPRRLVWLALTVGLGMGNHHIMGMIAAGLLVWLLIANARKVLEWKTVLRGFAAVALGLSVHAYLLIRARQKPPLNFESPDTFSKLMAHVKRDVYSVEVDRFTGGSEDVMRHIGAALWDAGVAVTLPIALLAMLGAFAAVRSGRRLLVGGIAGIFVLNTIVLNFIMTAPSTPLWLFVHRVYYVPAHGALALLAALGLERVFGFAAEKRMSPALPIAFAVVVATLPWIVHREHAAYQSDPIAKNFIEDFLAGVPENAGYFPTNDTVVFSLLYTEFVEGTREDVDILRVDMGWDGIPPTVVVHDLAVTPTAARRMSRKLRSRVQTAMTLSGLAWMRPSEGATDDWGFVEIPHRIHAAPGRPPEYNPFAELVRSQYAVHHALRGMWLHRVGRADEAADEFDRAEAIAPDEAMAPFMLAMAYERCDVRRDRVVPLLRRSLELHDTYFDKAGYGLTYPVERAEIRARLAAAERGEGQ